MRDFKTFYCLLTILALFVPAAYAETMTIGNYAINYAVPDEYIELNKRNNNEKDNHYLEQFDAFYKDIEASSVSLFIKKNYYEKMNPSELFSEYVIIYHMDILEDLFCSDDDFELLKNNVIKEFSSNKENNNTNGLNLSVSDQTLIKDEKDIFSFSQIVHFGEEAHVVFNVTNVVNIEGKILFIAYNKQGKNRNDIDEIIVSSDNFVTALHLEGAEGQPRPGTGSGGVMDGISRVAPKLLLIVGGVAAVMALLLGLLFFFLKRGGK